MLASSQKKADQASANSKSKPFYLRDGCLIRCLAGGVDTGLVCIYGVCYICGVLVVL